MTLASIARRRITECPAFAGHDNGAFAYVPDPAKSFGGALMI